MTFANHSPSNLEPAAWWRHGALLDRFVFDFIHAELSLMRRGGAGLPPLPWCGTLRLEADLGADSLERFALAVALSACLKVQGGGVDQGLLQSATLAQWSACAGASLERACAEVSFKTSGSSGVPKHCVHRLDLLWQEAAFFAAQLPQARRIVYAVPAHHIYGFLFTVLLPLTAALSPSPPLPVLDARAMLPSDVLRHAWPGDVIIGYPEFWAALGAASPQWPADVTGVTSTAPCPPALARHLAGTGLRLLEVYGSSETAGVGWRTDPDQPYALLPYWQPVHSESDDAALLQRQAADGSTLRCDCQDLIDWRSERTFVPAGRRDQAVQVGGVNVYPAQVAALLKRHPGVLHAHVRLMRPDEGNRLKAFVVPAAAEALLEDQLEGKLADELADQLAAWVRTRLPAAARPVSFTLGAALPANRQGKLTDWIIADGGAAPAE